jgi:hypothetical protein
MQGWLGNNLLSIKYQVQIEGAWPPTIAANSPKLLLSLQQLMEQRLS